MQRRAVDPSITESTTGYTITPFVSYFTSERLIIARGKEGPTAFSVSSEKHWRACARVKINNEELFFNYF